MKASGYERAANDWYVEPRWIVDALIDAEGFAGTVWDPACGGGNIPEAFKARAYACAASDIKHRGYGTTGVDFFQANYQPDNIVSNPPYRDIEKWITHSLWITRNSQRGKVALLARLALLEGQRRKTLFSGTPFARLWVSRRRVSMPPGGSGIEAKGGSVAFAWFVWEHGHRGPATIGWI